MTHVVTPSYCALWANRMTSGVVCDMCRRASVVSLMHLVCLALQKSSQLKQDLIQRVSQDCMSKAFVR